MEKFIAFLKTLILMIFIFGIILIGSIDMDMTERNMRNGNAEVETSAMIEFNI